MKIAVLGVGGHGWGSLSDYILNVNHEIDFWYLTTDWGGFTGQFGRVLELDGGMIGHNIHKAELPVYPWGDMNKVLSYYLKYYHGQKAQDSFLTRYKLNKGNTNQDWDKSLEGLKTETQKLLEILKINGEFKKGIEQYITQLCKIFKERGDEIDYQSSGGSIANFWQNYILYQSKNIYNFNHFYHQKGILPYNLNIYFSNEERLVLEAKDINGKKYIGEENIDDSVTAIDPTTYRLLNQNGKNLRFEDISIMHRKLKLADFIIIPNGSVANWLPLINQIDIQQLLAKKSKEGRVISLMNLFHTSNEMEYSKYINYLQSLNIFPIVLGPKLHHIILNSKTLEKYQEQGKTLNRLDTLEVDNYLGCLDLITEEMDKSVEGVKYNIETITNGLNRLIKN